MRNGYNQRIREPVVTELASACSGTNAAGSITDSSARQDTFASNLANGCTNLLPRRSVVQYNSATRKSRKQVGADFLQKCWFGQLYSTRPALASHVPRNPDRREQFCSPALESNAFGPSTLPVKLRPDRLSLPFSQEGNWPVPQPGSGRLKSAHR